MSVAQIRLPLGEKGITAFVPRSYDEISDLPTTRKNVILLLGDDILSENIQQYAHLIQQTIIPFAQTQQVAILDSGLGQGISCLAGEALARYIREHPYGETAPLIGIALKSQPVEALDPHHTQFLLADEKTRGDLWLYTILVAQKIVRFWSAVAIVFGGGEQTWKEIFSCLSHDCAVIAISGSGETADQLAAAIRGESDKVPPELSPYLAAEQDLLYTIPLQDGGDRLINILRHSFLIPTPYER